MTHLLDVNFLVALFDPWHVNHESAHDRFGSRYAEDWATSPTTESGCVRVLSNPAYRSVSATPTEVLDRLTQFCSSGGHTFWPEDLSPRSALRGELRARLQGHGQVTDFCLVALAARQGGCLATFDARLVRSLAGTRLVSAVALVR